MTPLRLASGRRAALAAFAVGIGWLSLLPAGASHLAEASARPGTVVRWRAAGTESCGRGSSSWPVAGETCWYPIDLLEKAGEKRVFRVRAGAREEAIIRVGDYPYPVEHITLEDDSQVNLSSADLARVRRDQALVRPLWSRAGPRRFELPLTAPLTELGEASRFGSRRFFNDQPRSPHSGSDFAAPEGTLIFSVAAGRVALAADLFFSGQSVFIDHGDGLISMYFHLSEMSVQEGDELAAGDVIGSVGATGRATGPHLHFGVRWRGARVDPTLLLGAPDEVPALPSAATR